MQERKKYKSTAKNIRIGSIGLEFSKRILSKYSFSRKSGKLPSLIFLKLFTNKIESGKIKPYPKSKSIINYVRFHFSLYFGMVRKSMNVSGTSPMEHVSFIIESIEPHLQSGENELKRISNSVKKISSKKYHTGSFEQDKILEFLNIRGKRAEIGNNFISMPEIFQPYGSKSDSIKTSGQSGSSTSIQSQYVQTINIAGKQLNSNIFPEFSYLDMFRQMMLHMHYQLVKNYGNLLVSKNKEIKDINHFHSPGSDQRDSSYHFSYLMTGPVKIALSPAASGYLQRNRHLENTRLILYNAAMPVMRKMNNEISFSESLSVEPVIGYSAIDNSAAIKTYNLTMNQNRIIQDKRRHEHTRDSDWHDSSHHFSYLMTGHATIALSSAASGYLQRYRHSENTGSIQQNPAMPVMRKMNNEISFSESLSVEPVIGYSAIDNSAAIKTYNLTMNQNRIIQDKRRREHTRDSDRHDSSYHFSHLLTVPVKIALSPAASGYLQRNRHLENTGSIRYDAASTVVLRKMNKEISFPGSLSAKPAKVYSAIDDSTAAITDNLPVNQNGIIQDIRNRHILGSDQHDSSHNFSYHMTGHATIALSPAASGYLQKYRHLENTGSILYNAAMPVMRKMNKEISLSGSSQHQSKNVSLVRLNEPDKNLNFKNLTGNNSYNPSELVIKRTPLKEAENLIRNTQEKTTSTRITDHSVKDSIREGPINEINRIADRVYHIIERKISIEKDRRGLL